MPLNFLQFLRRTHVFLVSLLESKFFIQVVTVASGLKKY